MEDLPIESGMLTDALNNAQKKVEGFNFNLRKQLFEYDQARANFLVCTCVCACVGLSWSW